MLPDIKVSPFIAGVIALLVTLLVTPWVKLLAAKAGAVAKPDARRLHPEPISQWGGLAVFLGVAAAALVWRQPTIDDLKFLAHSSSPSSINAVATLHLSTVFFGCGFLMLLLGMIDDRFELRPIFKFGGQILITYLLWHGGVRIHSMPFSAGMQPLSEGWSLFFTMVWVLGLTNAMNLIDGVDGLASGVAVIAAGSLCLIEQMQSANWAAAAAAAICGASLGFLYYNFNPAKIFLGDAGSLLLGFWLASIGVAAAAKTAAATTLALPLLVLGVPVFDTAWAIVRRTLAGQAPWKADRGHLHHRLLARGLSARQTVYVIYLICVLLGFAAWVWVLKHPSGEAAQSVTARVKHKAVRQAPSISSRVAMRYTFRNV